VRVSLVTSLCVGVLGAVACARPLERGEALYQGGRYVEAAETFEVTESRLPEMSSESCATFGLYRGLTYLRLDDVENARKWLAYSYSIEQKSPGMLLPEQRRLLERGWADLERRGHPDGAGSEERLAKSETGPAVAANTATAETAPAAVGAVQTSTPKPPATAPLAPQ
jgi:hypothetical protein